MRHFKFITIINGLLLLSCGGGSSKLSSEQAVTPKTPVEVTHIQYGSVNDELTLLGTTAYLKRNLVTAPIPAFITNVKIKLGDQVKQGDILYELESKERRALGNNAAKMDTTLANFGLIKVKASASGIISTLDKQQPGDYVLEGSQLCTIAESNDLVFQVNVPFEFTPYAKQGKSCTIILPDNTVHQAFFTKSLTAMNAMAQTQIILAKCVEQLFLPENLIVKVSVSKGTIEPKQVLQKSAVLTDEMMKEYWVMKLINDSIAIKVPVVIGNTNNEKVEIASPLFNSIDRIIGSGNYGLSDTALIRIVK